MTGLQHMQAVVVYLYSTWTTPVCAYYICLCTHAVTQTTSISPSTDLDSKPLV